MENNEQESAKVVLHELPYSISLNYYVIGPINT
jgi:hypothetical protein